MNIQQTTYNEAQLQAIVKRGGKYLSVQVYAWPYSDIAAGDVLGWHKTYDAACKRAGATSYASVVAIEDALSTAWQNGAVK